MRWIKLFLFFQVCLFFQMKLPETVFGVPFSVQLLFVGVLLFAIGTGFRNGFLAGFLAGALQDSLSLVPFGFNLFAFSLLGSFAGGLRHFFYLNSKKIKLLIVGVGTLTQFTFRLFQQKEVESLKILVEMGVLEFLPLLFWNSVMLFPLVFLLQKLKLTPIEGIDPESATTGLFDQFRRRMVKDL